MPTHSRPVILVIAAGLLLGAAAVVLGLLISGPVEGSALAAPPGSCAVIPGSAS